MTKSSSHRKNKSGRKHSKLSIMRKKLTLKHKVSAIHCELPSEGDVSVEAIRDEANVVEEPQLQNEANVVEEEVEPVKVKRKKLLQRASPMKLVRLYPSITVDQMTMIRNADYGGLLDIKCSKLQPELCKFLMESFDSASCSLVFPGRGSIPITEESVQKVIGVPRGKLKVSYDLKPDAIKFMREEIGVVGKHQPTIKALEKKLLTMKRADSRYLRLFIIYGMCSVLAPTIGVRISPRIYSSFIQIKQAKNLNVCKFVITMIQKATQSSSEKAILKSCMLYIMVKYLDSLQLHDMDISDEGTRVSVWTNAMVRKAIMQDTRPDGSFGNAPLKPEYAYTSASESTERDVSVENSEAHGQDKLNNLSNRSTDRDESMEQSHTLGHDEDNTNHQDQSYNTHFEEPADDEWKYGDMNEEDVEDAKPEEYTGGQTILFADPDVIDRFIRHNVPSTSTAQEIYRFKEAIEYACYGFEASLQMLVRKLPARAESKNNPDFTGQQISSQETLTKSKDSAANTQFKQTTTNGFSKQQPSTTHDEKNFKMHSEINHNNNSVSTGKDEGCASKSVSDGHIEGSEEELKQHPDGTTKPASPQPVIKDHSIPTMGPAEDDADIEVKEHPDGISVKDVEITSNTVIPHTVPAAEQALIEDQSIPVDHVNHPPTVSAQDDAGIQLKVDISDTVYKSAVDHVNHVACNNEDKANLYSLDALVAEYTQKKGENQEDVSQTGTSTMKNNDITTNSDKLPSTQAVDTGILEHKNVTYHQLSGVMFDDEDSSVSTEEKRRIEFMHYVGFSHIHKLSIPILQVPEISDSGIQENTSELRRKMFQELTNKPAPEVSSGLESLIDGSKTDEMDKLLLDMVPKVEANKRKKVSFADGPSKKMKEESVSVVPSPSRYRTRSAAREEMASSPQKAQDLGGVQVNTAAKGRTMTPRKTTHRQVSSPSDSNSRRQTRLSTLSTMATAKTEGKIAGNDGKSEHKKDVTPSSSGIKTTTSSIPSSAKFDPMNRKLNFDNTESERRMHAIRMAPDPPPFDLSTPPETNDQDALVVNEANKEVEIKEAEAVVAAPHIKKKTDASRSITPVVHEYQKRNVKIGHLAKSPFVNLESKVNYNVSKSVETLYNMVCEHGWKTNSPTNKEIVIDTTNYYCNLGQLADSVAPGKMLINTVAEIGIHIMTLENKNPKKYIMPLRVAKYLIDSRYDLKDVTRCFENSPANRLDHKEIVCFPTLEKWARTPTNGSGHYWLVVLNVKAERFEIIDSLSSRKKGEALMMEACHMLIAGIKVMWKREYAKSKVQIVNWPIEVIDSPHQTNTYDCGFFMLKNLEEKHGRMVSSFKQKDLPNIRKLYTDKWLRTENKAPWGLYI